VNSLVSVFEQTRDDPIPQHTSILTGALYTEEILGTRNPAAFLTAARIDKLTFLKFLTLLKTSGGLQDGRIISAEEKLYSVNRHRTDAEIRNFNKIQRLINLFGRLYFDPIQCIHIQRVYFVNKYTLYFSYRECIFLLCVNRTADPYTTT